MNYLSSAYPFLDPQPVLPYLPANKISRRYVLVQIALEASSKQPVRTLRLSRLSVSAAATWICMAF